jgi:hypothetical protein
LNCEGSNLDTQTSGFLNYAERGQTLARRWGAEPKTPVVAARPLRNAFELALDNAVEGLTREHFGALLGLHQAHFAKDPVVRRVMEIIAHDEEGHARFSAELQDWLWPRLNTEQRLTVDKI